MSSFRRTLSRTAVGAAAGLLAAFSALAVAELVAQAVLRLGIPAVLAVVAVGPGVLALSHRRAGAAGVLLFGAVASPTRSAAPAPAPP
ncbi:hypothetical protein [Streptomyces sp. WAC07061]|uniref:hypothetical protein n=1 Tax=Streptomyces sp. WAC07061 TaxID=2487410 RepID=UPI0027B9C4FD|nr:hypothetical protein [Streptomyces sp. WAC07061]